MKSNNSSYTKTISKLNLIGEKSHRDYLAIQSAYGIAQRGGVQYPYINLLHATRLINNINILTSSENKQLVFSKTIFSN